MMKHLLSHDTRLGADLHAAAGVPDLAGRTA